MNIQFKRSNVVKNSNGFSYNFYLNETNGIDYDFFNQEHKLINTTTLIDNNVLEFSVCIDKFDTIHLILLNSIGELIYFTCKNEFWNRDVINILDLRSNNYKHFNLLVFDDNVGYIYSYSNLINPVVWNIQYISIKPTFEKKNIITILAGNNFSAYSFAIDHFNDVHLLYRAIENKSSQIYYMNFSPFLNVYIKPPVKISNDKANNFHPYIFIDSHEQIHAMWTKVSSSSSLESMIMTAEESTFKTINTPALKRNIAYPIMLEENEKLKVIYFTDNSLGSVSSEDFGLNWIRNDDIKIDESNLYLARYSSNYLNDKNYFNINYSYMNINDNISVSFSDIFKNVINSLENKVSNEETSIDYNPNLESDSLNFSYMDDTMKKLVDLMSKNLNDIDIDNDILSNNYSEYIEKVEKKLIEYKDKNNDLIDLLNCLNIYYEKNTTIMEKLENDLDYLKENLERQKNNFFKSLILKLK